MSILRVVSHEPLTDGECRSLAPARAKRLAYSLSGRARYLLEMLTGEPAVADGGATPLNPQGRMGVDRSGPPWGDAHMHPMWTYAATLNEIVIYPTRSSPNRQALYLNNGVGTIARIVARFYVRPHYAAPNAPYTRAYLRGAGISDDLVTLSSASIRVYGPDGDTGPTSPDATVSTTGFDEFTLGAWCPVSPGYNERIIEIEQTSANGIYIGPLSLNQIVRRSH
jgi:hypothetical protein